MRKFFRACVVVVVLFQVLLFGSRAGAATNSPVDVDLTPDEMGIWVTYADGTVEARGTGTPHYGDKPMLQSGEHIVALSPTSGAGYWLFSDKGNVFAFGDAVDYGDVGNLTLNGPVIAAVTTTTGNGYYMLGTDGGIFSFGDAKFRGSLPGLGVVPDKPVVSMSATDGGYLLIAEDGGTFAFGSTAFYGSLPGIGVSPAQPVIDLVPGSAGYLMLGRDGGIFNFGQSNFLGALVGYTSSAAVSVAVKADLSGYVILTEDGAVWTFGDTRSSGVMRVTGNSDTVVDLSVPARSIVRNSYTGTTGNFVVWALDAANQKLDLLANEIGATDGWYWLDEPDTARFEISADGPWVIEVAPLTYATKWRYTNGNLIGAGNDVVAIPPVGPLVLDATMSGSGNNVIWHHTGPQEFDRDLLVNEIGTITNNQSALAPVAGISYFEIVTDPGATWALHVS